MSRPTRGEVVRVTLTNPHPAPYWTDIIRRLDTLHYSTERGKRRAIDNMLRRYAERYPNRNIEIEFTGPIFSK